MKITPSSPAPVTFPIASVHVGNVVNSGTAGGTVTNNAWNTCPINTVLVDTTGTSISISSNAFTLPAGTWLLVGEQATYGMYQARIRVYNVTDGAVIAEGMNLYGGGGELQGISIDREFTLAAAKSVRLEVFAGTATPAAGSLGQPLSTGTSERHNSFRFVKTIP